MSSLSSSKERLRERTMLRAGGLGGSADPRVLVSSQILCEKNTSYASTGSGRGTVWRAQGVRDLLNDQTSPPITEATSSGLRRENILVHSQSLI
jgi:hypothetical protein